MGVVYKARHLALKRTVALKMVRAGAHADPQEVTRFRVEAEAVARLSHPNIVQVCEVGTHGGLPFCALEFVDGGSLAQRLGGQPLAPKEAARLVELLAGAVSLAHSRNVIHRDLKPANVLLTADGTPKVSDFGLARRLDADSGQTQAGAVMGTPSYMAPEQASGRAHEAGPAADVYALGAILYACLTGRPPFRGATALETLEQVRSAEPVAPRLLRPGVPHDLETICLKCLQKEPERRYASARELADDLGRFGRGEPVAARPVGSAERLAKWVRRRPALAALFLVSAVAVVSLIGIAAGWWYVQQRERVLDLQTIAREEAETRKAEAEGREKTERSLRLEAEGARRDADRYLYLNRVLLAHSEWRADNVRRARQLLDDCPEDLRNWEWHYLRRLPSDLLTFRGHTGEVYCVAFSPDGRRLASGGGGGTVKVWDAATGQEVFSPRGHAGPVQCVAFSPDGTRLASGGRDQTVRVWDLQTGQGALSLQGHKGVVFGVAFSPDGTRLFSASQEGSVRVWDAGTGRGDALTLNVRPLPELFLGKGYTGTVSSMAFSPDGKRIAASHNVYDAQWRQYKSKVRVWDLQTDQEVFTFQVDNEFVHSLAFSPGGKRLAAGSGGVDSVGKEDNTGRVRVWDMQTGQGIASIRGHAGTVRRVAFSADGKRLASGSGDKTVKVWDATTGHELLTLRGHDGSVFGVDFSPDGRRLASASGRTSQPGEVTVWDVATNREPVTLRGHRGAVTGVAFSPDGRRLAVGDLLKRGEVAVRDATTGHTTSTLRGHHGIVTGVAFSPDGRTLAAAGGDFTEPGEVTVWDAATGKSMLRLRGHEGHAYSVAFSPDGKLLAAGGGSTYTALGKQRRVWLKVWDATTGQELLDLRGHTGAVRSVAFSPDGKRLASASEDHTVRLWEMATGQELLALKAHDMVVTVVAFSPDGRRLASGSWDGTVKVWDAQAGEHLMTLRGHTHSVTSVAFSPDGTRLASASEDSSMMPEGEELIWGGTPGEVKIWDTTVGQEALTLGEGGKRVAFSPDGRRLAGVSADWSVKIWDATPRTANPGQKVTAPGK
jgi:WD40 repeat protein